MFALGKRRRRHQQTATAAPSCPEKMHRLLNNKEHTGTKNNHHFCFYQQTNGALKQSMLNNNDSSQTPRTCVTSSSSSCTVQSSEEWDGPSASTGGAGAVAALLSTTTASSKRPIRVLFSAYSTNTTSPLRMQSPRQQKWKDDHLVAVPNDVLHGNLSMDSSLTSTSSLEEHDPTPPPVLGYASNTTISKPRYRARLWQLSRARSMMLLLSILGLAFINFTAILSMSMAGHLVDHRSSEAALRSSFLPRRRVRHEKDHHHTLSLTALAQGQQNALRAVTSTSRKQKKQIKSMQRHPAKAMASFDISPVAMPVDWSRERKHSMLDFNFYQDDEALAGNLRVAYLYDPQLSLSHPPKRHVEEFPADFTDRTQLYSILDSNDERVKGMELREPYSDGECVPMSDWQTTFHPSCNAVHELGLAQIGSNPEIQFDLFGKKGFWRNAWKVQRKNANDVFALKTLKIRHNFEEAHFEHDRVDAVAMERLTGSPHVIDIFGFCGHSVYTEYADGKRLGSVADKARKEYLATLEMAKDIAEGLADVHGIDGDDKVSFVHLDVNPANVIIVGDKLKLNDFNIGIIRRWNTTSNEPCGFPAQFPNPQWRSPEEARNEQNLTEKVDVFSLGHIFFRLISGAEPWNRLEPGGKPTKDEVNAKVQQGILPTMPDSILQATDPEIIAIRDVMLQCYEKDPKDRPSAREIANTLQKELLRLRIIGKNNL